MTDLPRRMIASVLRRARAWIRRSTGLVLIRERKLDRLLDDAYRRGRDAERKADRVVRPHMIERSSSAWGPS